MGNFYSRCATDEATKLEDYFKKYSIQFEKTGIEFTRTSEESNPRPLESWADVEIRCTPDYFLPDKNKYVEHKTTRNANAKFELLPFIFNLKREIKVKYAFYVREEECWYVVDSSALAEELDCVFIHLWRTDLDWQISEAENWAVENNKRLQYWKNKINNLSSGTPYASVQLNKMHRENKAIKITL